MAAVVQYILVRGDLMRSLNWPLGAVIAQACHASVAATQLFYTHEHTQQYLQDLDHMHKVVLEVGKYNNVVLRPKHKKCRLSDFKINFLESASPEKRKHVNLKKDKITPR